MQLSSLTLAWWQPRSGGFHGVPHFASDDLPCTRTPSIYLTKATIYVLLSTAWRWAMAKPGRDPQVAAIRAFNRFYTRKVGVVDGIASSPFSLAEARVLYEL